MLQIFRTRTEYKVQMDESEGAKERCRYKVRYGYEYRDRVGYSDGRGEATRNTLVK